MIIAYCLLLATIDWNLDEILIWKMIFIIISITIFFLSTLLFIIYFLYHRFDLHQSPFSNKFKLGFKYLDNNMKEVDSLIEYLREEQNIELESIDGTTDQEYKTFLYFARNPTRIYEHKDLLKKKINSIPHVQNRILIITDRIKKPNSHDFSDLGCSVVTFKFEDDRINISEERESINYLINLFNLN
eukprot:TRINITY_DN318_c0_g1_i3.p1 TRINITY_DN318_c0_g1~~TRINITY_DN318_c0_g1_i3.p1  ORF type:complete len:187 (-),score=30.43 TRINITY_DN318_c0_g1_i3:58-618(-)